MQTKRHTSLFTIPPNACFGVIALSSAARPESFADGIRTLEEAGYRVRVALDPCAEYGSKKYLFSSASKEQRAATLHALYRDPEIDAVISVRGAYGALELLPLINFEELARYNKPLLGISDVTALLLPAHAAGIAAIHAPALAGGFSEVRRNHEARQSFDALIALLSGAEQDPFRSWRLSRMCGHGSGEGALIGGNLTMLASLMGTPWEPELTGQVLFFEEVGEHPYRVHRLLQQLKLAGKLSALQGVVVGALTGCVHPHRRGPSVDEVLADIFMDARYPVLYGAPFGHQALNLPVPLGIRVRINESKLELLEPPVLA